MTSCRNRGHRRRAAEVAARVLALLVFLLLPLSASQKESGAAISKSAAASCGSKVKALETHAAHPQPGKNNVTKFSEEEINSYLALDLRSKYHPSLKSLVFTFDESVLESFAVIDFDQLAANSRKLSTRLLAGMFSGVHNLRVRGRLITKAGKAKFQLIEARFDDSAIPNFLVEEIITVVGRRQKPPFDPMQFSQMPWKIQQVDLHKGHIVVHQ